MILDKSVYRAYDIRGKVPTQINNKFAYYLGQAFAERCKDSGDETIAVAYDGRLSSPELAHHLIKGIAEQDLNIIDIGEAPTPVLYYATHVTKATSGIMVTGSHNPSDDNGFKIVAQKNALFGDDILDLYQRMQNIMLSISNSNTDSSLNPNNYKYSIKNNYIDALTQNFKINKPLKVIADTGNGVSGPWLQAFLEKLPITSSILFADVDGRFPNHHPDPSKAKNLQKLKEMVLEQQADIGLAFDGDGDRLGIIDNLGQIVYPDQILMWMAKDTLKNQPGANIVYDVKCSRHLKSVIEAAGGKACMYKTGHSLVKKKMKEMHAPLAGEMSGHLFFGEPWFSFDDAMYAAGYALELLSSDSKKLAETIKSLPQSISTPEINIAIADEDKFECINKFCKQASFPGASISNLDGLRADFNNGFGLIRASNTTANLVMRFEADDQQSLDNIKNAFEDQLKTIWPSISF